MSCFLSVGVSLAQFPLTACWFVFACARPLFFCLPPFFPLPTKSPAKSSHPNFLTHFLSPKLPSPKHVAIQLFACTANASQIVKSTDYSRHSKYHHPIPFSFTLHVFFIRLHLVIAMSETCLFCDGAVAIPRRRWLS